MKKLNSIIQKIKNNKYKRLEKDLHNNENKITLLKEIDVCLADAILPDVTLKIESKDDFVQKKLNKSQKTLSKSKENYESRTAKTLRTTEKKLKSLEQKISKEKKCYEAKLKKIPAEKEKQLKTLEEKHLKTQTVYETKIEKVKKSSLKKTDKILENFHTIYEKEVYKVKVKIAHLNHQNKVINDNLWWINLPEEEKKDKRTDLSFYIPDTLGYWLTLLTVAAELVYLVLLLSEMEKTFWVGTCILVNIAFLLLIFTVAIKVKNYKKKFSYISIGFGLYCILRISYIIHGLMGVDLSAFSTVKLIFIYGSNAYMIIASIFVGLHSYFKIKHQIAYLDENKITKFQLSK